MNLRKNRKTALLFIGLLLQICFFGQNKKEFLPLSLMYPNKVYIEYNTNTILAKTSFDGKTDTLLRYTKLKDQFGLFSENNNLLEMGRFDYVKFSKKKNGVKATLLVKVGVWHYFQDNKLLFVYDYTEGELSEYNSYLHYEVGGVEPPRLNKK